MSNFLGFESFLIPLGSTVADVHATIKQALTDKGWQVAHDNSAFVIDYSIGSTNWSASYPYARLFDDSSSGAAGATVLPIWAGCKFTTPAAVTKVYLALAQNFTDTPRAFTIDYSDDGSAWTTASSFDIQNWKEYETRILSITPSGSHLYWRMNITSRNGGSWCYLCSLGFGDDAGNHSHLQGTSYFDIYPPSTESVGDSLARDLVRFEFDSTSIKMRPTMQSLFDSTQSFVCWEKTAGAVQCAITVDGVTVTQDAGTVNAGNTAKRNLRYLYDALRQSADPKITDWTWEYQTPSPQGANDTFDYICGIRKTFSNVPLAVTGNTNVNITASTNMRNHLLPANYTSYRWGKLGCAESSNVTIDLTNGFIYYMQINARGIALATKTNVAYYGPIHACYGDHAKALAARPVTGEVSVIELMVGYDDDSTNTDSHGRTSHVWGISSHTRSSLVDNEALGSCACVNGRTTRDRLVDTMSGANLAVTLPGSNIWVDASAVGNNFQIHRIALPGITTIQNSWATSDGSIWTLVCPMVDISDWYKFTGTATNEALILIADTQTGTTLSTQIGGGETPTTITVASTTGFNETGYVVINEEVFQYTGLTATTFTGVTRAKYGTVARTQYVGDKVQQCLWFTVINGGALFCGYNKPS